MSGSVIPILGMLTKKNVIILGTDYNREDYQNAVSYYAGNHKPKNITVSGPNKPISASPANPNPNPPGVMMPNPYHPPVNNTTPVNNNIQPPAPVEPNTPVWPDSPGGEWTGDGWDNSGGGGGGGGGAMDSQPPANQQAQPLGNDENGCPYYGVDQQGNKLYGKDASGNPITDPKILPCYLQKKSVAVASKSDKANKWFIVIGLFIIGASVGFGLYKSKKSN